MKQAIAHNYRLFLYILPMLSIALASICFSATPREIAEDVLPGVVLVTVFDSEGLPLAAGSGFFISKDEIATNFHVLAGGHKASAKMIGSPEALEVSGVVAADKKIDLTILKVSSSTDHILTLASVEPAIGETVYVAGNPEGLEGTFSSGMVSGKREIGGVRLLQITAPISPGSSGSPVVNEQGSVIGVAVSSMRLGQSLNFAIPIKELATLERILVPRSVDEAFRTVRLADEFAAPQPNDSNENISEDGILRAYAFTLEGNRFSFTVNNGARTPVCAIDYIVIPYTKDGHALDSVRGVIASIQSGLAKRVTRSVSLNLPDALVDHWEVRFIRYSIYDMDTMYVVGEGDTAVRIARTVEVTLSELLAANPRVDWRHLRVGQILKRPKKQ